MKESTKGRNPSHVASVTRRLPRQEALLLIKEPTQGRKSIPAPGVTKLALHIKVWKNIYDPTQEKSLTTALLVKSLSHSLAI